MPKPKKLPPEPFDVGDFLRPTDTDLRSALSTLLHGGQEELPAPVEIAAPRTIEPGPKLEHRTQFDPSTKTVFHPETHSDTKVPAPLKPPPALELRTPAKSSAASASGSSISLQTPLSTVPPPGLSSEPKKRQFAVRPALLVEDGHSRAEQQVYARLWDNATPHDDASRLITLGFASMGKLTGLSESNARINLRSLIQKLAVEEHTTYDCAASQGRTYRVFEPAEVLRRRHAAGLRWVMRRTLAVVFVDPESKLPLFYKAGPGLSSGPNLVPPVLLTQAIRGHLNQYGPADPATVQRFLAACQHANPHATPEQIATAIHDQALLTAGMPSAERLAFLLDTVPGRLAN